ncbi:unnamed protein product [Paramecium sonneborni]|uniref:Uncharacterized protein n=1 Tax=Paramecium sonneborni TaxID=65129 RepID=A0A8S1RJZ8_9CILI|nr:unnamed protein product [Paramecium sonneborni]
MSHSKKVIQKTNLYYNQEILRKLLQGIYFLEIIINDITMRVTGYFEKYNLEPSVVLVLHYHKVKKESYQKSEPNQTYELRNWSKQKFNVNITIQGILIISIKKYVYSKKRASFCCIDSFVQAMEGVSNQLIQI